MLFKTLALVAVVIGFVLELVNVKSDFVMAPMEWFVMAIALALIAGLEGAVHKS